MCKKAKIKSWKEFCGKQDKEELWQGIYQVIRRTAKRQEDLPFIKEGKVLKQKDWAKLLTDTFYPDDLKDHDNLDHRRTRDMVNQVNGSVHDDYYDPLFTFVATNSFSHKKAPGLDSLTANICKRTIDHDPKLFLSIANKCLKLGYFPDVWKEVTVIVLNKPGWERYTDPKAYRPIGLLPVLGKIFEKMVVNRIKWHVLPKISTRQYEFMPQKSTEDALYVLIKSQWYHWT